MLNAWKRDIPSPIEAFRRVPIRPAIEYLLSEIARCGGRSEEERKEAVNRVFALVEGTDDIAVVEAEMKKALAHNRFAAGFREAIRKRSEVVFSEIAPYLTGTSMLDVGCGNGIISELAKERFSEVLMLDVIDYVSPEVKLPFKLYRDGAELPVSQKYDTVLMLTVLHHSQDPGHLLQEAWRWTQKSLIIIESVYGTSRQIANIADGGPYFSADVGSHNQLCFAVLVDWLYNRVLHDEIPVPYNFMEPSGWEELFRGSSMEIAVSESLGRDITIAPELHHLYVLSR